MEEEEEAGGGRRRRSDQLITVELGNLGGYETRKALEMNMAARYMELEEPNSQTFHQEPPSKDHLRTHAPAA